MKQSILKFTGKKFITAAFLSASLLLTGFNSKASVNTTSIEILSDDKSSVQFAGSTADALIFKVHIKNESGENFKLTIKNDNGEVLFSDTYNNVNFEKQIKMLKDMQSSDRYYFSITSANKNLNETYIVSAVSRTIDDVVVNKM